MSVLKLVGHDGGLRRNGGLACAVLAGVLLFGSLAGNPADAFPGLHEGSQLSSPTVIHVQSRRERIAEKLEAEGYTQIEFQGRRLFGYVVNACQGGRLYRLSFDPLTVQRSKRVAGDCPTNAPVGRPLSPEEVELVLRDEGYYRIRMTDRQLPGYAATACFDNREFQLSINRRGEIRDRRDVGACRGPAGGGSTTVEDVRQKLRALGFSQIQMISRDLPPTRVEACKSGRKYAIRLDRRGEIVSREFQGSCGDDQSLTVTELQDRLRQRSYYRFRLVREESSRVVFEACRSNRQFRLTMAKSGRILSRSAIGWCRPGRDFVERDYRRFLGHFPSAESLSAEDCDDYLNALLEQTRIRFATNSAEISARSERLLENVGQVMNLCPNTSIEVAGHTDSTGSTQVNERLSRDRALSVVRHLVQREGVQRSRLQAVGYGESQPIASNNTERGKQRNRRIEMVVLWNE